MDDDATAAAPGAPAAAGWRAGRRARGARAVGCVVALLLSAGAVGACGGSPAEDDRAGGTGGRTGTGARTPGATAGTGTPDSRTRAPEPEAGSRRTVVVFTPDAPQSPRTLERTAELMRQRAAALGMRGVRVEVDGGDITATGRVPAAERLTRLGEPARLEFRPVRGVRTVAAAECRVVADAPADGPLTACGKDEPREEYTLGPVDVPGTEVSDAAARPDEQSGAWTVLLEFTAAGSRDFAEVTGRLAQNAPPANRFAIVLDGKVLSAPSVAQALTGGEAQISGGLTRESATELAALIDAGALPVPLSTAGVTRLREE